MFHTSIPRPLLRRVPALRAVTLGSNLSVRSWIQAWRAAGLPQMFCGSVIRNPDPIQVWNAEACTSVVHTANLRSGKITYITIPSPYQRHHSCAIRNEVVPGFDQTSAKIAAMVGNARVLRACPDDAFSTHVAYCAARYGHLACLRICARVSRDMFTTYRGGSPAFGAVQNSHLECLCFCIEVLPQSLLIAPSFSVCPLYAAALGDNVDCLRLCVENCVDFLKEPRNGCLLLWYVLCGLGQYAAVRLCQRYVPEAFHRRHLGQRAAHCAAEHGSAECLRICFEVAPETRWALDDRGMDPRDIARTHGFPACVAVCDE
jgi:hypothetical protein